MKKLISLIICFLAISFFSLHISAEEANWYNKQSVEKFVNLLLKDREEALEFKSEEIDGDGVGAVLVLTNEELELLKNKKDYLITTDIKYETTSTEIAQKYIYVFEFFTSDYKHYVYKHDFTKKNFITVHEILSESGIKDSEKLIYGEIRYFECPYITNYSFAKYKKGWNNIQSKVIYVKSDGNMITKSCNIGGVRYKFTSDGVYHGKYTGWTKSTSGRRYYKNGIMLTNRWLKTKNDTRYYAGEDGYIVSGERYIGKEYCLFDKNGKLIGRNLNELGMSVHCQNVSATGLEIAITLDITVNAEKVEYGSRYTIEKKEKGKWKELPLTNNRTWDDVVWLDDSSYLSQIKPTLITVNWKSLYGELPKGTYRISKEFNDKVYYFEFII